MTLTGGVIRNNSAVVAGSGSAQGGGVFTTALVQANGTLFDSNLAVASNGFANGTCFVVSPSTARDASVGQALGGGMCAASVDTSGCQFISNSVMVAGSGDSAIGGAVFALQMTDTTSSFVFNRAMSLIATAINVDTVSGQTQLPLAGGVAIGFGLTDCLSNSEGIFNSSIFNGNGAVLGGAIALCSAGGNVQTSKALFLNNIANMGGAVIALNGARLLVSGGLLSNNSAMYGGAVALAGASQCTLSAGMIAVGNTAQYQGGVVYVSVTHAAVSIDTATVYQSNMYAIVAAVV